MLKGLQQASSLEEQYPRWIKQNLRWKTCTTRFVCVQKERRAFCISSCNPLHNQYNTLNAKVKFLFTTKKRDAQLQNLSRFLTIYLMKKRLEKVDLICKCFLSIVRYSVIKICQGFRSQDKIYDFKVHCPHWLLRCPTNFVRCLRRRFAVLFSWIVFFFRGCFLYLKPKVSAKVTLTTVPRSETSKVTHFANPQFNPKHMQGKRSFPQHLYHQKDKMNNPHRKLCA